MKTLLALVLFVIGNTAFAAPKEVIDAVLSASNIKDVTSVEQVSSDRCFGCFVIEVKGQGPFGDAYQKIRTQQTGASTYSTDIIEQSR